MILNNFSNFEASIHLNVLQLNQATQQLKQSMKLKTLDERKQDLKKKLLEQTQNLRDQLQNLNLSSKQAFQKSKKRSVSLVQTEEQVHKESMKQFNQSLKKLKSQYNLSAIKDTLKNNFQSQRDQDQQLRENFLKQQQNKYFWRNKKNLKRRIDDKITQSQNFIKYDDLKEQLSWQDLSQTVVDIEHLNQLPKNYLFSKSLLQLDPKNYKQLPSESTKQIPYAGKKLDRQNLSIRDYSKTQIF